MPIRRFNYSKAVIAVSIMVLFFGCKPKEPQKLQKPKNIHHAAIMGNTVALEEFLDAGVSVDARDKTALSTPLHFAAANGHKEIVDILIARGANVNIKNSTDVVPLALAMMGRGDSKAIAEILIDHGADINAKDSTGRTPLHAAVLNGQPEMVMFLLAKGAKSDAKMGDGKTPLDLAILLSNTSFRMGSSMRKHKDGFKKCVELLRDHGLK